MKEVYRQFYERKLSHANMCAVAEILGYLVCFIEMHYKYLEYYKNNKNNMYNWAAFERVGDYMVYCRMLHYTSRIININESSLYNSIAIFIAIPKFIWTFTNYKVFFSL